jgi:putative phage-type endonuclease
MIEMIEQRSDEWFAARLGKVTASRVADVIAKTKTGYSTSRENYMAQLVVERMTQKPTESYSNAAMAWGTDQEPFARAAYELAKDVMVEEVGFVPHPNILMAGASPDGFVGVNGLVEIKCPTTSHMIEALLTKKCPQRYFTQIQFQLACTDRVFCDYVVFDPRMPKHLQLFVTRIERDEDYIAHIEDEIQTFLEEVESKVNLLNSLRNQNV